MSSNSLPVILVRADASPAIGSGHVMRCLALAKAWQSTSGRVSWVMAESIPALEERLRREGITCTRISLASGSNLDASRTVEEAQRADAAWVVVDGYRFTPDYLQTLKGSGRHVLFIDDDGRFESYGADAVLNQNVSAAPAMYTNRQPFTQLLLGPDYVLLRSEFLNETPGPKHPPDARNVLITMGGSDP